MTLWCSIALLLFSCLLYSVWPLLKRGLRWGEKRYFAYIGDSGPLLQIDKGRWTNFGQGICVRSILYKRKKYRGTIRLHIARIDPKFHDLQIWWGKPRRIKWIMQHTKAVAAINGGLFLPQNQPWGFFKQNGQVLQKHVFRRPFDGVFSVGKKHIKISPAIKWQDQQHNISVFQSTPLLISNDQRVPLPKRYWQVDRRSALCIDQRGRLLLMTTDGFFNGLSFHEMQLLLGAKANRGGFACRWALNLDGGATSQWAIRRSSSITAINGIDATPIYLLALPR